MSQEQEEKSAEIQKTFRDYIKEEGLRLVEKLPAYIAALEALDVTEVIFSYEGEGDEGEVYDVDFKGGEEAVPDQLEQDLNRWAVQVLNHSHPGWQDGDGSRGEVHLDVATKEISVHHAYRVYDYETEPPIVVLAEAQNPDEETDSE